MNTFTIAGRPFSLDRRGVEKTMGSLLPDPLREHYVVVVGGRRFPPKQVLSDVTRLDRADFTTHQARRILKRLGSAARLGARAADEPPRGEGPYGGRQAAVLRPHRGKWVALSDPLTILVAADTPEEVLSWLARHEQRAGYGMFRVPATDTEAGGAAPL